jgi:hypothetical protein
MRTAESIISLHPGAPVSEEPPINLFARWKPLKQSAKALDRPVGGTPVKVIISLDRDR